MGIVYDYIFARTPGKLGFLDKKNHSDEYYEWRDTAKEKLENTPCIECSISDQSGNTLHGYYYQAGEKPSKKIAFIVHGYRSDARETAGVFRGLYQHRDIDLFAVDNPASGNSDGTFISFDYYESEAILKWITFLKMRFGEDVEIILHGFSLGGATVLMISDRVPDNVKFIIDDCGFISGAEMIKKRAGSAYTLINLMVLIKNKMRFSLGMTDVRPHLRNAKVPILVIHGEKDPTVPFYMGQQIYSIIPTYKDRMYVDVAKHMECYYYQPKQYAQKVYDFIDFFM